MKKIWYTVIGYNESDMGCITHFIEAKNPKDAVRQTCRDLSGDENDNDR